MNHITTLEEFEQASVRLPDAVIHDLQALKVIRQNPPRSGDTWTVKARERVGCVRLHGTEIWIEPKLPVSRLLYLAGHGRYRGSESYRWLDEGGVHLPREHGLVAAMAILLAKAAGEALQPGVLHGYQEREECLPLVRGRIRLSDQARRHFGLPVPVEVRYEELTADIPENRRLLAAILKVIDLPGIPPEVRGLLAQLRGRLAQVPPQPAHQLPPLPPLTHLNRRYEQALALTEVVLGDDSLEQRRYDPGAERGIAATGFLFDMDDVFQDYLAGMLATRLVHAHGGEVKSQYKRPVPWSGGARLTLRPDIVWLRDDGCAAVIDAKYKGDRDRAEQDEDGNGTGQSTKRLGVESSDVYQIFTYCKKLGARSGHLIHADTRTPPLRRAHIDGVDLLIHAIDLSQPLQTLHEQEARIAEEIARSAGVTAAPATVVA